MSNQNDSRVGGERIATLVAALRHEQFHEDGPCSGYRRGWNAAMRRAIALVAGVDVEAAMAPLTGLPEPRATFEVVDGVVHEVLR